MTQKTYAKKMTCVTYKHNFDNGNVFDSRFIIETKFIYR